MKIIHVYADYDMDKEHPTEIILAGIKQKLLERFPDLKFYFAPSRLYESSSGAATGCSFIASRDQRALCGAYIRSDELVVSLFHDKPFLQLFPVNDGTIDIGDPSFVNDLSVSVAVMFSKSTEKRCFMLQDPNSINEALQILEEVVNAISD